MYNTLTFSELLLLSVSIGDPDAIQPIPLILPCPDRSHMHGDSRMVMINSRSLVYTKVHQSPPVIGTGCQQAHTYTVHETQCPSLDSFCMYQNLKEKYQ